MTKPLVFCSTLIVGAFGLPAAAHAVPITFTYMVTGNANATQVGPFLTYSFVPLQDASTLFGPLDVRYQGAIDFSLANPSGPTTTTWDFHALGGFGGSGLESVGLPNASGIVPFSGTSVIDPSKGTGIFAFAGGTTFYTGSLNAPTGIATFTETVMIDGPSLPVVPEPATVTLFVTAIAAAATVRSRRKSPPGLEPGMAATAMSVAVCHIPPQPPRRPSVGMLGRR